MSPPQPRLQPIAAAGFAHLSQAARSDCLAGAARQKRHDVTKIGIIGGSGIYDMDGLEDATWVAVDSPWGTPSDAMLTGRLDGVDMVFLPRHGRGHVHSPTDVPYRANIDALKRLGVTHVVSVSACGSFREEMAPGDFVIVDQFIDRTFARAKSFFSAGCVAHVSVAHPTCPHLSDACHTAARDAGITVHAGGTYLAMEGPQFSSRAESVMYKSWGCDVIGMTNMPEAKLAREAELCYASVAMVTDYDSWHPDHGAVDVAEVIATLQGNGTKAADMIRRLPALTGGLATVCGAGCQTALDNAIMTAPSKRDPALLAKLDAVAGRVL
ncbi:S-methyl-5'-thioadenosine phosphorylase [Yoonia sp. 208BN28-4]|uniref:S-methyl-5'-thioadenosine phosphorylase n=1 Tax=Yoonia sp. 208BN28-4 TaxID=3126505 RepID=UPI00309D61D7